MEKAVKYFLGGIVLLGSALLKLLESLLGLYVSFWIYFIAGVFLCISGIILYKIDHPNKEDPNEHERN